MALLIYSGITSLDGYLTDESGSFDWAAPDEEVHTFLNELERSVRTNLYGRRMYEVMAAWEDMGTPDDPPFIQDFASVWKAADKVVYSGTLEAVPTTNTRLERTFDLDEVRRMKAEAAGDMSIGGPTLAAAAIRAGLVDEYYMVVTPVIVGGGLRFLPDDVRLDLVLLGERRFDNGMVYLRYGTRAG